MLTPLYSLHAQIDGRYAADTELQFAHQYCELFRLRLSAYQKLQRSEAQIVQQVQSKVLQLDPNSAYNLPAIAASCQRDMQFVLRYSAIALLLDDTRLLEENVLLWLQTILRSFKEHQKRADLTYQVMQEVVQEFLTPAEASLFCPILELDRRHLGID
jgi:hypothetical protein